MNDELIETLIVHLKPSLCGCTLLVFLPGTASISRLYARLVFKYLYQEGQNHQVAFDRIQVLDSRCVCTVFWGTNRTLHKYRRDWCDTSQSQRCDRHRSCQTDCLNERKGIKSLIERFVSKASAAQRAGRAGRVMKVVAIDCTRKKCLKMTSDYMIVGDLAHTHRFVVATSRDQ